MDNAWTVVRVLALAYLGYLALVFLVQRSIVFPGAGRSAEAQAPSGVEVLWLNLPFGRVEAWRLDAGPTAPVALFTHGNGELIDDWRLPMGRLRDAGVSVLLVEYPGYGRSQGRPSRSTIRATLQAAWDRVREEAPDGTPIVALGRSLGAAAAADLSRDRPVDALVLMSTLSSAGWVAWRSFGVPPLLVRDRFDVRSAVSSYEGPVLLMHGTRDQVLPFEHALRVSRAREGLDVVPMDCGHNDCLSVWPATVDAVVGFLHEADILAEPGPG